MKTTTNIGTEVKLVLKFCCGEATMDEMNFTVDFYTTPSKVITLDKSLMKRRDEHAYIAVVDTSSMSAGFIQMKVRAEVPDNEAPDGTRTEICTADTKIFIKR